MSQVKLNVRSNCQINKIISGCKHSAPVLVLIFLLMMLDSIIWGGWMVMSWMKNAHQLPLSQLVVTGERHYTTKNDMRQAILALSAPGKFITQNINVIQQQIERMPWIKQVSVRKQWPDELQINLMEYVPVARWNDLYLLDKKGKRFSVPEERIVNHPMPMLYGPKGSEQYVLVGYHKIDQMLTSAKFQLKSVSMSSRHSWQLTLRDDIRLELGRNDKIKRLKRFIGIYPVLLQQSQNDNKRISYVDLRYDVGLSVGWAPDFIKLETSNQKKIQVQAQ